MSNIEIQTEKNFRILTINKPRIHNALTRSDINEICSIFDSWANLSLTAIILTGYGRSLCSGLFMDELESINWSENPISKLCKRIETVEVPTICALNGSAYGGGVEIALSCDFRLAKRDISLAIPAAKLGIHYDPKGMMKALNLFGSSLSRRLFLLGETIDFDEIEKTEFVDFWIDESDTVLSKAKALAKVLEGNAPLAVKGMKKVLNDLERNCLDELSAGDAIKECFQSNDHAEALRAKREKRNPVFRGD